MNRNLNAHYSKAPRVNVQRSVITDNPRHLTTASSGYIYPFHWQECIPGSTYTFGTRCNLRSLVPPVHSPMDIAYADTYYFFIPLRLIYEDFKHFIGEPEQDWIPNQEYTIPQISFPEGGFSAGSLADHFGLPINTVSDDTLNNTVSALPFRAYNLVYNEYFRSNELQDPVLVPTDGNDVTGWRLGKTGVSDLERSLHGAELLKACKPHDVFTSCQRAPLRGPEVMLPLGSFAPVVSSTSGISINSGHYENSGLAWGTYQNGSIHQLDGNYTLVSANERGEGYTATVLGSSVSSPGTTEIQPLSLIAKLDSATSATINDLRVAISVQHLYEALAIGGNRYRSILYNIFGVEDTNPCQDVPEYIGGKRFSVSSQSIYQNSQTDLTPQGNVSGIFHINTDSGGFNYSAREHGVILGLFVVRQPKTYQQGINKMWLHKNRFDFYHPQFANLGSMPVLNKEIYFGTGTSDGEVFGYQEAWYEYRFQPDIVTGAFRSNFTIEDSEGVEQVASLDSWHYADYYDSLPILSDEWITDNSDINIGRTLSVQSTDLSDQWLVDISINRKQVLPMPVYSIPGLERI